MPKLRSVLRPLILVFLGGWVGIVEQPTEAQQTVTLSGRVIDSAGQAVSGATVNLEDPGWAGQETDANGAYRLSVPPGTYRLRVRPPHGPLIAQKMEGLTLSTDSIRNILLKAGVALSGQVTDPTGQPVPGVHLALSRMPGQIQIDGQQTDRTGAYRFSAPQGNYHLNVKPHDPFIAQEIALTLSTHITRDIALEVGATPPEQVTGPTGQPASRDWLPVIGPLIFVVVLIPLVLEMFQNRVSVEPIQVPEKLADRGYTPRVAAQHLIEAILEVQEHAGATPEMEVLESNRPTLDFIIPATGFSIKSAVSALRSLLGRQERLVSGELLYANSGNHVWLRLRVNRKRVADILGGDQKAGIDQLHKQGAYQVLKAIDPYVLASYYYVLASARERDSADHKRYRSEIENLISFILAEHAGTESATRGVNLQGILLNDDKEFDAAIDKYQEAIELDPKRAAAYNNWGVALHNKDDHDGAIKKYQKAIALNPKNARAHRNWGDALESRGDHDGAIKKYQKAIALNPKDAEAYNNWGDVLDSKGDHDGAIKKYRKATELDPKLSAAYLNWGVALHNKGNHDDAIKKYQKAIALNPKDAEAYNNWGVALHDKDDHDDAIKKYQKAIALNPKDAGAYRNWGDALRSRGDHDDAIKKYQKAIALNPKDAEAYNNWGDTLDSKGNHDDAIEKYRKATELDPQLFVAYFSWGLALHSKGNHDGAIEKYRKATELDPQYALTYKHWGDVLDSKGDHDGAIKKYRKATELDPQLFVAYFSWGLALHRKGNHDGAIEKYRKATELDP